MGGARVMQGPCWVVTVGMHGLLKEVELAGVFIGFSLSGGSGELAGLGEDFDDVVGPLSF